MSEHPPRKKLRQMSLIDMMKSGQSNDSKKCEKSLSSGCVVLDIESDSSQNMEGDIEGTDYTVLPSTNSDTPQKKELANDEVEKWKEEEKSDNERDGREIEKLKKKERETEKEKKERKHEKNGKEIEKGRNKEEKLRKSETRGKWEETGETSVVRQRDNSARDYVRDGEAGRSGWEGRKGPRTSTDHKGKAQFKGQLSRKPFIKKQTPKKSPKRSPMKSRDGHPPGGGEMRSLLAEAAEKRRRNVPSPDMFADDGDDGAHTAAKEMQMTWQGTPLSSFARLSIENQNVPPVSPAPDHTVLVRLPLTPGTVPAPHPTTYTDSWDQYHVRMPCSPKSQYPVGKGSDSLVPRWSVICQALKRPISTIANLQSAVLEYNARYASKWKFKGLECLVEEEFEEEERDYFFNSLLPAIVRLALNLPKLVTQPPPLLTAHTTQSVSLSQQQVACLLANAFFCTFPRRNATGSETEYASYPDINFNRLFFHKEQQSLEKMKCLLNYFRRVTTKEPVGVLTFSRQCFEQQELPQWELCSYHLPRLHIDSSGLIEDATGLLQVDFANKCLGGGVLGRGCVQEEIRFVLSPELIVSRLFTQVLDKTEAVVVTGVEQYNQGSGYASTFKWAGSYEDSTPADRWCRRLCQVTAIDALHFTRQPSIQYRPSFVHRELNKAFAGLCALDRSGGVPVAVASGNWGCGAFNGDPRLKSLIQLAVCGFVGRDLAYFTFGDQKLCDQVTSMHIFMKENNITVGELIQCLNKHGSRDWVDGSDLFHFIYHYFGGYNSDAETDTELPQSSEGKPGGAAPMKVTGTSEKSLKLQKTSRNISDYFRPVPRPDRSSSRPAEDREQVAREDTCVEPHEALCRQTEAAAMCR